MINGQKNYKNDFQHRDKFEIIYTPLNSDPKPIKKNMNSIFFLRFEKTTTERAFSSLSLAMQLQINALGIAHDDRKICK